MSNPGDIYLGVAGSELLLPGIGREYSERDIELSRQDRTASGRLVRDIIATKKAFSLRYSMIDGEAAEGQECGLNDLYYLYSLQTELSLIVHYYTPAAGTTTTTTPAPGTPLRIGRYTVLMQPIERTRILAIGTGLWGNVTVELEEV
jgi:hypothetical protein